MRSVGVGGCSSVRSVVLNRTDRSHMMCWNHRPEDPSKMKLHFPPLITTTGSSPWSVTNHPLQFQTIPGRGLREWSRSPLNIDFRILERVSEKPDSWSAILTYTPTGAPAFFLALSPFPNSNFSPQRAGPCKFSTRARGLPAIIERTSVFSRLPRARAASDP